MRKNHRFSGKGALIKVIRTEQISTILQRHAILVVYNDQFTPGYAKNTNIVSTCTMKYMDTTVADLYWPSHVPVSTLIPLFQFLYISVLYDLYGFVSIMAE